MGARHAVVHLRAGERLPGAGLDHELLPQRLADTLRDGTVGLTVDNQRIDAAANVVNGCVARERELAAVGIDLYFAYCTAIWKNRIVHFIVGDDSEALGEIVGKLVSRHFLRQLEKIETAVGLARSETAVIKVDTVGRSAEDMRDDALAVSDQRARGHREHRRGMAHGTA